MSVTPREDSGTNAAPSPSDESGQQRSRRHGVVFLPLIPVAATLLVTLVGIRGPSFWLDEAATTSMTTRSYEDMFRALEHLDLVHALYYLIMRPWVLAFGTGELAMRLPSALAMAAAAGGVAVIGRRCHGTATGLLGGLAFAVAVPVTRFGQEARSYALVTAVAVLATYLFLRAVEPEEPHRWRWFTGYLPAVMVVGFLHLHGALLLAAHGITLLMMRPRAGIWVRWSATAVLAAAPLVPFALAAQDQKSQVRWLPEPSWDLLWKQAQFLSGGRALSAIVLTLVVIGAVAGFSVHRRRSPEPGPDEPGSVGRLQGTSLTALALPWLVVPTVLLFAVSIIGDPMFLSRYTAYCVPAVALLVGAGLARVRAAASAGPSRIVVMAVAVVALVTPSLPRHGFLREQDSRLDDTRAAAMIVRAHAQPGDAIVYLAGIVRWNATSYPDVFGRLRDVSMQADPVTAANLEGRNFTPRDQARKLAGVDRVWVMDHRSLNPPSPVVKRREAAVRDAGPWREVGIWKFRGGRLSLLERTGPYRTSR